MKHRETTLLLSGVTAALGLTLSAVSLTISVVAALQPPVSEWFSAAENVNLFAFTKWLWIAPAVSLMIALVASLQVVLRRSFWIARGRQRRWMSPSAQFQFALWANAAGIVMCSVSASFALAAIPAAGTKPLTDSSAFGGLSISIGLMAMMFANLSLASFDSWWRGGRAGSEQLIDARDDLARA